MQGNEIFQALPHPFAINILFWRAAIQGAGGMLKPEEG
jgi:hypothetical protein